MKEKWNKKTVESKIGHGGDGQPVPKKFVSTEPMYKPKLLHHSPSLREAMRNYRDVSIGNENEAFEPDLPYDFYVSPDYSLSIGNDSKIPEYNSYEYPTLGKMSVRTTHSGDSGRNSVSEHNEMGSSVKLVTVKVDMSCQSWCSHMSTVLCTLSIAAGLGNLYRLPQATLIRGGLPFLIVYVILTVIIGLPLLFLELGIGQMAQEGFIKSWRAVPFFKGIGYVKLLAGCLLSIYYPLYMGLALLFIIWIVKGPMPFSECTHGVIIKEEGYYANGKSGDECLRTTFISSPLTNPYYFGIYVAVLLFVWILITLLSIKRTKSYIKSLLVLFFPTLACYITLTTKSILFEGEIKVLHQFFQDVDWSVLADAEVWYYATIQVFFSTNMGFGSFITNAGILYHKVNPLSIASGYILANILFGTGSVVITTILTANLNATKSFEADSVAEVELFALIYDSMRENVDDNFRFWMLSFFALVFFSGLISMATLPYTLLKAIHGHDGIRLKWWHSSLILSLSGFVLGCVWLLRPDFDLVHLLDHYIVGNLILICVILEVLAFIAFYGTGRILSDFEFMLGHILWKIWLILWWLIPLLLMVIFAWGLATLPLEGIYKRDPSWLYGIGWAVILTAFVFIFVVGLYVVSRQDGYTLSDKLKASLEPSHNWGPKDPMLRHNWVQWNTKTQSGERDFTLKRRGTKDYTKTIKKNAKKAASDLSSTPLPGVYHKTDNNNTGNGTNYKELYYISDNVKGFDIGNGTVTETTLMDSLEVENGNPHHHHHHHHHRHHHHHHNRHTLPVNPLACNDTGDGSSEGYGTFRKGPYVIGGVQIDHVCHRRGSEP